MSKFKDITGQKFGRLTALHRTDTVKGKTKWLCLCDCGNLTEVRISHLTSKHTTSCGCIHKENTSKLFSTHNKTKTRIYKIWIGMKQRCYNSSNQDYKYYGGRDIVVCSEWKDDFQTFYNWAMSHGYNDNLTIDRIDVNKNYTPYNCQWTTRKQQGRNRRTNLYFTIGGVTKCLKEWCELYHINYNRVRDRVIKLNWTIEKALELK